MKKYLIAALFLLGTSQAAPAQLVDITIDISEQEMFVQTPDGQAMWPVSTGRYGYDTPTGTFFPYYMAAEHFSKKYDNAPMPNSIFFIGGYAIHGTMDINNLGQPASHGCVRLHPQSAALLYRTVKYYGLQNTLVRIVP